jgi:hypothetical protein
MAWAVVGSGLICFFVFLVLYISAPGALGRRLKHPDGDMANEPEEE